ncbi:DUF3054 domain-containing protein [Rudaeicoccus suwonensis]|uniref:DUF3054 domain-containing protein n=1 Tax=Rudaeicoccus suwonensis TaxID=657409 RepID=UPI001FE2D370|nr:DUF3054 domain-containing protein [Rudaeicoccus suwonensis]
MKWPIAAVLDVVMILVFAAIGRASHHEASPVLDACGTAWPFLAGAAAGWVLVLAVRREPPIALVASWPVWLLTVGVGMAVRHVTGRGVAVSFVIVATLFLGLFMMGWRAIALLLARRRTATA